MMTGPASGHCIEIFHDMPDVLVVFQIVRKQRSKIVQARCAVFQRNGGASPASPVSSF